MTDTNSNDSGNGHKIFFGLIATVVAGALAFAGILHAKSLEELFIYKEENRLYAAKESIFKAECQEPRREQERLAAQLQEQTGAAPLRMKEIYQDGSKAHELYKAGEKIALGEKYVEQKCAEALKHAGELKRGNPRDFVIANFFGGK